MGDHEDMGFIELQIAPNAQFYTKEALTELYFENEDFLKKLKVTVSYEVGVDTNKSTSLEYGFRGDNTFSLYSTIVYPTMKSSNIQEYLGQLTSCDLADFSMGAVHYYRDMGE